MPNELYFEKIGSNFDEWISDYDVVQRVKLIKSLFPLPLNEYSCIEVGCGTGRISQNVFKYFAEYVVSDISKELANRTGDRLGVRSQVLNASDLSGKRETFDVILSSECIEHTEDPLNTISQMSRLLKPGGYLILTTPNRLWYPVLWISLKLGLRRFKGVEHWIFPHQAIARLKELGFKDIVVSGCHLLPWQIPTASRWLPFLDRGGRWLFPLMINFGIRARKRFPEHTTRHPPRGR